MTMIYDCKMYAKCAYLLHLLAEFEALLLRYDFGLTLGSDALAYA